MKTVVITLVILQVVGRTFSQFTFDRSLYNDSVEVKSLLKEVLSRLDIKDGETKYKDCSELKANKPETPDGVYEITARYSQRSMKVFCDMTSEPGKGWTVLQRRLDGSVNFHRNWFQYKYGFGNLDGEFWIGNDNMYHLTNQDEYVLKIDLKGFDEHVAHAQYQAFYIADESKNYRIALAGYNNTIPNSVDDSLTNMHNNKMFSTWDRDNDLASVNCAAHATYQHGGGWWFGNCDTANLNGHYLDNAGSNPGTERNIEWGSWTGHAHRIKYTVMKIRPSSDF